MLEMCRVILKASCAEQDLSTTSPNFSQRWIVTLIEIGRRGLCLVGRKKKCKSQSRQNHRQKALAKVFGVRTVRRSLGMRTSIKIISRAKNTSEMLRRRCR